MAPSMMTTSTVKSASRPLTVATWIEDPAMAGDVRACLAQLPVQVAVEKENGSDADRWFSQLEQVHPDVVLLGLSQIQGGLARTIERIRAAAGDAAVVAVDTNTDPQAVLAAVRAGAAEYVYPPVAEHLGAALERVTESRSQNPGRALGKTVAFVSAKGGCGATTVACHVASSLRQLTGKTTLLADLDLDNGVIGFLTKTKSTYTIEDAIQNVDRLDTSYWKALVSQAEPGLDVICSAGTGSDRRSDEGCGVIDFTRTQYDWVVVDLGRGLTHANRNALKAIDEVYVVTTLDVPALYRCQQMVRSLIEMGCSRERVRLVVNRISKNADLTKAEIEHMIGIPVSFELQDDPTALGEAYVEGKLLPPNSDLSRRMSRIARQIGGIAEPAPAKSRLSFSWLVKPADTRVPQVA